MYHYQMELEFTCKTSRLSSKGYTLVELLMVMIIVGIMAGYGTYVYQEKVRSAKITEAALAAKEVRQAIDAHVAKKRKLPDSFTRSMAGINSSVIDKIETIRISDTDIQVNVFLKRDIFPDEPEQQVYTLLGNLVSDTKMIAWQPCREEDCITPASKLPTAATSSPPSVGSGGIVIASGPSPGPAFPSPAPTGPSPSPTPVVPSPAPAPTPSPSPTGPSPSPTPAWPSPAPATPSPSPAPTTPSPSPTPAGPSPSPQNCETSTFTTRNQYPIWNAQDANYECPTRCNDEKGQWTGHWWTTVWGKASVCQCNTCPKPTATDYVFTGSDESPIWSDEDATKKCPQVCSNDNAEWTRHWWTIIQDKSSVCLCIIKAQSTP